MTKNDLMIDNILSLFSILPDIFISISKLHDKSNNNDHNIINIISQRLFTGLTQCIPYYYYDTINNINFNDYKNDMIDYDHNRIMKYCMIKLMNAIIGE